MPGMYTGNSEVNYRNQYWRSNNDGTVTDTKTGKTFTPEPGILEDPLGVATEAAFDLLGMPVTEAGPPPNPDDFFKTAEGTAQENYARALDLYNRAGQRGANVNIREPGQITPSTVTAPDLEYVGRGEAPHAANVSGVRSRDVLQGPDVTLGQIQPVERVQSSGELVSKDVGPIGLQRTSADASTRSLLQGAAEGRAPSAAEAMLRYGLDQSAMQRLGAAAGSRGRERAGLKREAVLGIGADAASLGQTAAAARAGEMATARGQLSTFAMQASALEAEQNRTQAELDRAIAQGNQAQANALQTRMHELEQQRQSLNAQAENSRASEQQGRAADIALQNRATNIGVQTGNVTRGLQGDIFSAGAENTASLDLARRQDESEQQHLARLQATYNTRAAMKLDAAGQNAQRDLAAQIQNIQNRMQTDVARSEQDLSIQNLQQTGQLGAQGAALGAGGQLVDLETTKYNAANAAYAADVERENQQRRGQQQLVGQVVGAAIGGPAGASVGGTVAGATSSKPGGDNVVDPKVPGDFVPAKYATGGLVHGPTRALIGEAGPEAVIPLHPRAGAAEELAATLRGAPGDPQLADDLAAAMMGAAMRARKNRRAA